jgi:LacI family transcriptional regulator
MTSPAPRPGPAARATPKIDSTAVSPPASREHRRPTIHDVAALSNVSKSTVSNVLRGTGSVSDQTRATVLGAIKTLGYRPNAAARNLVQRRTNLIGVVVGNIANSFNAELVKRIEQEASTHQYTTLVCNTSGQPEFEAARIDALLEQRVDGLALLEFSGDRALLSKLLAERVPVVMISCWADYADCVAVDDYAGIGLAVGHLVGLGHERIGYATDELMETTTSEARLEAFERAVLHHGRPFVSDWVVAGGEELAPEENERQFADVFLAAGGPTAMVAANDYTAIRLIQRLEAGGLLVPGDVSIVGFDGIAIGALPRLALTTVAQPPEELARGGLGLLLERIERGHDAPVQRRRLDTELVVRGSTAPPTR